MRQARTPSPHPRARLRLHALEDRSVPATLPTGFTEVAVAAGLSNATAMEIAPNGDLWVLEQSGPVKRFRPGSTTADQVANLSGVGLRSEGERGVLGIAFDPAYASNKFVYIYYTSSDAPNPHNRISRFTVNDANAADYSFVDTGGNPAPLDEVEILNLDALSSATNHNGGAIHFGTDGKLYVAVGDNATGSNAQNINNRHGKILRINADGSIPGDNPTSIAGISGTTTGANRAIWAAGVRNPFTFTFRPGTSLMHINDVGQNTWEEVNVGGAGRNFGWPGTEGDFTQSSFPNFTRPLYAYNHGSGTFQGFAITGGAFYNPTTNQFPAEYAGDYFFADYVNDWINVIDANWTNPRRFATGALGTVDLRVATDGTLLYLARDQNQVFRVTYTASTAPAITQQPQSVTVSAGGDASFTVAASGSATLTYQWQKLNGSTWTNLANGSGVSGATTTTLTLTAVDAADAGDYRAVVTNSAGSATSNAATLTVTSNQAPSGTVTIDAGLTNGKFVAGQAIAFSGTGTDPEDGTLGAAAFTWRVDYITSIASGNPVVRPFVEAFSGQTGGTFTPATTGPYTLTDVAYRITLTLRDSGGLTTTRTLDVTPNVANITVQTSPAGGTLTVDAQPYASGTSLASVVGFQRPIGAPATQTINGTPHAFQSWSDGGAATHTISTPPTDTTYTATYTPTTTAFTARINFQPTGIPVPANYVADTGAVFGDRGNGYSYGWNANNAATARDRNAPNSPDQRYDTLQHLQRPENPNARWELAVPNGSYAVRVVAGDAITTEGPSVIQLNAEGVQVVAGFVWSPQWLDNTVTVTVSDGRLTISNGSGAYNNKINFIDVTAAGQGAALPAGAAGRSAAPGSAVDLTGAAPATAASRPLAAVTRPRVARADAAGRLKRLIASGGETKVMPARLADVGRNSASFNGLAGDGVDLKVESVG